VSRFVITYNALQRVGHVVESIGEKAEYFLHLFAQTGLSPLVLFPAIALGGLSFAGWDAIAKAGNYPVRRNDLLLLGLPTLLALAMLLVATFYHDINGVITSSACGAKNDLFLLEPPLIFWLIFRRLPLWKITVPVCLAQFIFSCYVGLLAEIPLTHIWL